MPNNQSLQNTTFFTHSSTTTALTQKNTTFDWTEDCQHTFKTLKHNFCSLPYLSYPQFHSTAKLFVVYTDASDVGLGAVLKQNNCVIAYASCTLTKTIQKESLAIVYTTSFKSKQTMHQFQIQTDHAPLQWLSAQ